MCEQEKKRQRISDEEFQKLAKEHNELVETYTQYTTDLQNIDEVSGLAIFYLPVELHDKFDQMLMTIRKNLLKEQKEVSQEISEGKIWKYVG